MICQHFQHFQHLPTFPWFNQLIGKMGISILRCLIMSHLLTLPGRFNKQISSAIFWREHILFIIAYIISWWWVLTHSVWFSILSHCSAKAYPLWTGPDQLGKMSSSFKFGASEWIVELREFRVPVICCVQTLSSKLEKIRIIIWNIKNWQISSFY